MVDASGQYQLLSAPEIGSPINVPGKSSISKAAAVAEPTNRLVVIFAAACPYRRGSARKNAPFRAKVYVSLAQRNFYRRGTRVAADF